MLRFYLLGQFRIEDDTGGDRKTVPLPRLRKTQSLLAYLLLNHDARHTRERLGDLFWGDVPGDRARASMSTALAQIRTLLSGSGADLDAGRFDVQLKLSATLLDVDVMRKGLASPDLDRTAEYRTCDLLTVRTTTCTMAES
ncbi:MAG TPA: hypothetical protein VF914_05030 [Chloroflexia bacterium]|jgi:DNA-binding SARP family transcriptional activator